jgi:hypothetical protein
MVVTLGTVLNLIVIVLMKRRKATQENSMHNSDLTVV